jgi:hypothetical protein
VRLLVLEDGEMKNISNEMPKQNDVIMAMNIQQLV